MAERQPAKAAMALRLGKLFGNETAFWQNRQRVNDLRRLEAQVAEELAGIPTLLAT
ncbi:hypothetical protein [Methylobacterium sp. WL64]|uniref:hypothetical protein n=1 Tax=Methylobacterium sp. WL64 TaxID=2603894 RepID=UPI0016505D35|nr:hypothetical protein [Methylobacterium sp. WL64]